LKLLELFDSSPIDVKVMRDRADQYTAEAPVGGRAITFNASLVSPYSKSLLGLQPEEEGWSIDFGIHDGGYEFRKTGDGVPAKVLAFVKQQIEALIKKRNPDALVFSAEEKRAQVYDRMLKKVLPSGASFEKLRTRHQDVMFKVTLK
jgi:hypothetical protein